MNGHNLLQGGGDWTNVIIPGNAQNSGFNHKKTYEVTNLKNDAEYECLVQARNQFGWSEASRIFHFFTGKRGTKKQPRFELIFAGYLVCKLFSSMYHTHCCAVSWYVAEIVFSIQWHFKSQWEGAEKIGWNVKGTLFFFLSIKSPFWHSKLHK